MEVIKLIKRKKTLVYFLLSIFLLYKNEPINKIPIEIRYMLSIVLTYPVRFQTN